MDMEPVPRRRTGAHGLSSWRDGCLSDGLRGRLVEEQGIPEWMTAISWFDGDIHQLQTMLFEGHVFGNYVMIWCLQRVTMCLKSPGFGSFGLRNN